MERERRVMGEAGPVRPGFGIPARDVSDAEDVDRALAAAAAGVAVAEIRAAWGAEPADLAAVAARLASDRATPPRPAAPFVHALEARVAAAFDARPAPRRLAWPRPRLSRLGEMSLVGGAAAALAVAAFLLNPARGVAPHPTPTVQAATATATAAAAAGATKGVRVAATIGVGAVAGAVPQPAPIADPHPVPGAGPRPEATRPPGAGADEPTTARPRRSAS